LRAAVARVGPTEATTLLFGENGVGKELVARALHEASPRRRRPLVTVNCAAVPETLFESELFGHQRGAFTGAIESRRGKFQQAHGGTLFLDEVGEIPLAMQPKLLRALESGETARVGGGETERVDVRVIAASNRDLAAEVRAGRFREDLYFRLNVVPLRVRRSASARRTFRSWRGISSPPPAGATASDPSGSTRALSTPSAATVGPATFASCATPWSASRSWSSATASAPRT